LNEKNYSGLSGFSYSDSFSYPPDSNFLLHIGANSVQALGCFFEDKADEFEDLLKIQLKAAEELQKANLPIPNSIKLEMNKFITIPTLLKVFLEGQVNPAIVELEMVASKDEYSWQNTPFFAINDIIGIMLTKIGKPCEAVKVHKKAFGIWPQLSSQVYLARAAGKCGDKNAVLYFKNVASSLSLVPESEEYKEAMAYIEKHGREQTSDQKNDAGKQKEL